MPDSSKSSLVTNTTTRTTNIALHQHATNDNGTGKIAGQSVTIFNISKMTGNPNTNTNTTTKAKAQTNKNNFTDFISLKDPDPTFRPIGLRFNHDQTALYIVSIGKEETRKTLPNGYLLPKPMPWFYQNTGVLWKFTYTSAITGMAASQPPKKIQLSPGLTLSVNSGPPPASSIFNLPPGYKIQPVLWNLNLPGAVAFDDKGNMYIAQVAYSLGWTVTTPEIYKLDRNGTLSVFVDRMLGRPLTDIEFYHGKLYVASGGKISVIDPKTGLLTDIIAGLPSIGDHFTDQIAFGPDGSMHFGQGTTTSSGVVGKDNFDLGWLQLAPMVHDIPGKNITLAGENFITPDPLTRGEKNGSAVTGAFSPFGVPTHKGEVIKGDIKCSGCILSAKPDGTDLKLVAWGLRHPYGVILDKEGRNLIIAMDAADERASPESRPIHLANDAIIK